MNNWLRVELHCHTVFSPDSLMSLQGLLDECWRKGIDRVAITDHNTIQGAVRAKAMDPERVIVGEEILTREGGEVLAFYVEDEIPAGLPALEVVQRLREQGALISISHPFDKRRQNWRSGRVDAVLPYLDAVEVFNSRCLHGRSNDEARQFAKVHLLPGTVGSDAHCRAELGRSTLLLPAFCGPEELRKALPLGQAAVRLSSPLVHFTSRYAVGYKKLFPNGKRARLMD